VDETQYRFKTARVFSYKFEKCSMPSSFKLFYLKVFDKVERKLCYMNVMAVPLMQNFKPAKVNIRNVSMKLFPPKNRTLTSEYLTHHK
jgi:hypothetical protein